MAEGALFNVAEGIIGQLGNQALKELGLLWGVKEELKKLEGTVSTIKAVILDAEEQQAQNHTIRIWLARLKDALLEADDLLDDFSTEDLRREVMTRNKKAKEVRIFFSKSNQLAYGLKMGHEIKAIRERLDAIAADRKFHLEERPWETQVGDYRVRETHSFIRTETVVGRDKDREEIKKILLDPNVEGNVSILPIVSPGGLGKTTLAQLVFSDKEIEKQFDKKLWVCVSDEFNVQVIVKKILESARKRELENLEMDTLVNDLKKEIDGKRYLLVLDDVWNEDSVKWLNLKKLLMSGARGSKILVTSRSAVVAMMVQTVQPYFLKGLSELDSQFLFKQIAFENGQEPVNSSIEEIGLEILRGCGGVPLLIKTVGGLLYFKNTSEAEWLSFKDHVKKFIKNESNDILPLLKLSYYHLPPHLKQCFAFFCLFPKDYKFHKPTLIQMWIAQGFIMSSSPNLEEVGHEYFMELLWRSFFQEVEKDESSNILYFKIHDMMHDIAILIAKKSDSMTFNTNEEIINEKIRHVSFDGWLHSSSQIPISLFAARNIRTFLLPSQPNDLYTRLDMLAYEEIVTSFKFIRVLDLHNLGIEVVPRNIGELKHLRYLDLSYNECIMILPNSIAKLLNLQTLKLSACTRLKELPRNFNKLVNLMYLEIFGCVHLNLPDGLDQLANLQILQQPIVGKDLRENLVIELRYEEDVAYGVERLKEREHLHALRLRWIEDEVEERDAVYYDKSLEALHPYEDLEVLSLYRYCGERFPSWLLKLTNLVEFALFGCKKCQHLPPLDEFHSLRVLELNSLPALEYISNSEKFSNSVSLSHLLELKLKYCPNLRGWWGRMEENHSLPLFRRLLKLCIRGCPKLTSMPRFPYLDKLELYYCSFKPLEQTSIAEVAPSSSFGPLHGLQSLEIGRMEEPLPIECLKNLVSLDHLLIYECRGPLLQGIQHLTKLKKLDICSSEVFDLPNDGNEMEWKDLTNLNSLCLFQLLELKSLPAGLQHVTSLKELMLDFCPSLNVIPEWICNLIHLHSLEISQCPKLKSLPVGICGLTSLQTLKMSKCLNFTSLPKELGDLVSLQVLHISEVPKFTSFSKEMGGLRSLQTLEILKCPNFLSLNEWMGGLASLQTLYISECPKLISLPEGMRGLTTMQNLIISACPILVQRCHENSGEEWPKIAHIPHLLGDLNRQGSNSDEESNEAQKKTACKCWSLIKTFLCCNCLKSTAHREN